MRGGPRYPQSDPYGEGGLQLPGFGGPSRPFLILPPQTLRAPEVTPIGSRERALEFQVQGLSEDCGNGRARQGALSIPW